MSECPVIFSGPMVRAILEGRKTQTRRIMQIQPSIEPTVVFGEDAKRFAGPGWKGQALAVWPGESEFDWCDCHCPQGAPGDALWVRETWRKWREGSDRILYRADKAASLGMDEYSDRHHWKPSIHLPRRLARLFLTVKAVRVERLQDISEADAIAEGLQFDEDTQQSARFQFHHVWDHLNAKRAPWSSNPWVWVIEFERRP